MSQLLRPTNFDAINLAEKTELSADVASSQKDAGVISAQGIVADDFFVIGNLGAELSELSQLDTKSGNTLTAVANYANAHKRGDELTKLFGDKIRLYRAANVDGSAPADGSFSLVTTIDIDVDQQYSEYTDPTGGDDYWYKKTYYNSQSTSETQIADSIAIRGGNYGYYVTAEEVQNEAGLKNNRWIPSSIYQEKLQFAQSEVNGSLKIGGYTLPLTTIPKIVKNATLLLAAGYVLVKDYGVSSSGTTKDGEAKIQQARDLLMKIEAGDEVLIDDSGNAMGQSNKVAGYPDSTAEDQTPSEARIFTINTKF